MLSTLWKQLSNDERIKGRGAYSCAVLFSHKEDEILSLATVWMELIMIMLTKNVLDTKS